MNRRGRLFVVGLGPGDRAALTGQARQALERAEVVIGYAGYFPPVADLVAGKECLALPLTREAERARLAGERLRAGQTVCVISSGDPGVYGMAGLVLEHLAKGGAEDLLPEVEVIPGVSAVNAAAALLGAPLGHDFAVVSLSDLLTPWDRIERRFEAAAGADFVLALLNPQSRRRDWQFRRAQEILARHRPGNTPVGVVRNAYRAGQSVQVTTLGRMAEAPVDMFTTVIVGNSQTRRFGPVLVTPRGYPVPGVEGERGASAPCSGRGSRGLSGSWQQGADAPRSPVEDPGRGSASANGQGKKPLLPEEILAKSFRIIEEEIGEHPFGPAEWPVVRRMIHASGDLELTRAVHLSPGAVAEGIRAFRDRIPIVTDVQMVASGIHRPSREALGVPLHCFLNDPGVEQAARERGRTRSYWAMARAAAEVPEAVFVIGSAPTALLALAESVRRGVARPRLIVAMPVGFVSVAESKEEALALGVPVIAVRGRKGGSAVAAAAVNALLLLAREGGPP